MRVVITICSIIGYLITVCVLYRGIFVAIGLFKVKHFKKTNVKHKYAICICARNEGGVIGNLLESIHNQDYPLDKLDVIVCPNNCTDNTADVVREFAQSHPQLKIHIFERQCSEERTKGFALRYMFEQIKNTFPNGVEEYEGYFIFDADNVLKKDYVTRMNEGFDAGNKILTSFRNSKNMHQNWISFSYGMLFMRTSLTENRAKAILNQSCRIQGTGYLFANELVRDGWKFVELTEDRMFCSDAVANNYKISYVEDAVFYDEQPTKLKVSLRQWLRWSKGHLQSAGKYCPKLFANMFKKDKNFLIQYDFFWLNFPYAVEGGFRKLVTRSMEIALACLVCNFAGGWTFFYSYFIALALRWVGNLFVELLVWITYRKQISTIEKPKVGKTILHFLMFPFLDLMAKWTSYVALFKRVEWKPIPHDQVVDIKLLDGQEEEINDAFFETINDGQ